MARHHHNTGRCDLDPESKGRLVLQGLEKSRRPVGDPLGDHEALLLEHLPKVLACVDAGRQTQLHTIARWIRLAPIHSLNHSAGRERNIPAGGQGRNDGSTRRRRRRCDSRCGNRAAPCATGSRARAPSGQEKGQEDRGLASPNVSASSHSRILHSSIGWTPQAVEPSP
jgi:hypothetical protein